MAQDEFTPGAASVEGLASDADLTAHGDDTTGVHGITDTAQVALRNAANTFTVGGQVFPRDTASEWGMTVAGGMFPPVAGNAGQTYTAAPGGVAYVILGVSTARALAVEWDDALGGGRLTTITNAQPLLFQTEGGPLVLGTGTSAIGFFGSAGGTKPTVTGSRATGAATASLLTALAALGLVIDNSTA